MLFHAALLIAFGLLVNVADAVPKYDIARTCRAAVAMTGGGGQGRTVENCVNGEEAARKDLEKHWATAPTAERTQCMGSGAVGGSHSYVELSVCLEMMRDSRARRDDEQAKTKKR
ncbi:MAG: hypothetical protein JO134_15450 [Xanthobacteraceae bacterium]|nr:hypothetical protein [Xanthobacteraceae bacterium]